MPQSSGKRPIITEINPQSPISEAYRTLRTNIEFSACDDQVKTIVLTSAGHREGRTTTVINLAVAYAQADKKVIVVDADLRSPAVHHVFMKPNRVGLTHVLSGQASVQEVIQNSHLDKLDLLTSGKIPPNPSELLSSGRMDVLLDELKRMYDMVILDTPPALAVSDAQIVAARCDGAILILDAGKVKRAAAVRLKGSLEHVKANILGVVLNNVKRKSGDTYGYRYRAEKDAE